MIYASAAAGVTVLFKMNDCFDEGRTSMTKDYSTYIIFSVFNKN